MTEKSTGGIEELRAENRRLAVSSFELEKRRIEQQETLIQSILLDNYIPAPNLPVCGKKTDDRVVSNSRALESLEQLEARRLRRQEDLLGLLDAGTNQAEETIAQESAGTSLRTRITKSIAKSKNYIFEEEEEQPNDFRTCVTAEQFPSVSRATQSLTDGTISPQEGSKQRKTDQIEALGQHTTEAEEGEVDPHLWMASAADFSVPPPPPAPVSDGRAIFRPSLAGSHSHPANIRNRQTKSPDFGIECAESPSSSTASKLSSANEPYEGPKHNLQTDQVLTLT